MQNPARGKDASAATGECARYPSRTHVRLIKASAKKKDEGNFAGLLRQTHYMYTYCTYSNGKRRGVLLHCLRNMYFMCTISKISLTQTHNNAGHFQCAVFPCRTAVDLRFCRTDVGAFIL